MRLIDADEFRRTMYHEVFEKDTADQRWDSGCWIRYRLFERILEEQPSAQPERIRGRWGTTVASPTLIVCNRCGRTVLKNGSVHWNFCPNCGAKMEVSK